MSIFGLSKEPAAKFIITIDNISYDPRKFKRPWIAKIVAWPSGADFEVEWGKFLYESYSKKEVVGFLEISAQVGDLLRWGQRPACGPEYKGSRFFEKVLEDTTLQRMGLKEAREYWKSTHVL